jgi:hypothetical protein
MGEENSGALFYVSFDLSADLLPFQNHDVCSTEAAEIIVSSAVDFCEAICYRVEDDAPCYLIICNEGKRKKFLRLNPERTGGTILTSRQGALISALEKTVLADIRVGSDQHALLFAFQTSYGSLWDYAFLKVSAWLDGHTITFWGLHKQQCSLISQTYRDGNFLTDIENEGAGFLMFEVLETAASSAALCEKDFTCPKSQWSFYAE